MAQNFNAMNLNFPNATNGGTPSNTTTPVNTMSNGMPGNSFPVPQMNESNPAPRNRPSILLDKIGIQRSNSPFSSSTDLNKANLHRESSSILLDNWNLSEPKHMGPSPVLADQRPPLQQASSFPNVPTHSLDAPVNGSNLFAPPAPPGIGDQSSATLPPIKLESQWTYIDSQGQPQGPFTSTLMTQWLQAGYFQPNLQIKRMPTSMEPFGINDRFVTLNELISKVNNFQDPFQTFDLIVPVMNAKFFPAQPIQATVNKPTPAATMGANANEQAINEKLSTGDYTLDEILNMTFKDGSYYREVIVQLPFNRKIVTKLDDDFEIPPNSASEFVNEIRYDDIEYRVPMKEEPFATAEPVINTPEKEDVIEGPVDEEAQEEQQLKEKKAKKAAKKKEKAEEQERKRLEKAELMAQKLLEEQERQEQEKKLKEEAKKLKKQRKEEKKLKKEKHKLEKQKKKEEAEKEKEEAAIENPAPWAEKTSVNETQKTIPMAEILKRHKEQEALAKKQKEQKRQEDLLKLSAKLMDEDKKANELKSVLSWANKPAPEPVRVNIQPQLKEKKQSIKMDNNSSFVAEQQKIWEQFQKTPATAVKNTIINDNSSTKGNAWTTVTPKPAAIKANGLPSLNKAVNQPSAYVSPDKLRNIASGRPSMSKQIGSSISLPGLKAKVTTKAPVAYPGNASVSTRQEFLRWARTQLKLNPGVSMNSVLEVLLMLPASASAKEIIADTIYANSTVMDGRRFATDFIKRRIECEKQLTDPLSWKEALSLPEGNDDDWEFQVVSKKKGKKY